jgi:hypothetical protein
MGPCRRRSVRLVDRDRRNGQSWGHWNVSRVGMDNFQSISDVSDLARLPAIRDPPRLERSQWKPCGLGVIAERVAAHCVPGAGVRLVPQPARGAHLPDDGPPRPGRKSRRQASVVMPPAFEGIHLRSGCWGPDWYAYVRLPPPPLRQYLVIVLLFAACYYVLAMDTSCHLDIDSFLDAYYFSLETLATVGYGACVLCGKRPGTTRRLTVACCALGAWQALRMSFSGSALRPWS